MPLGNPLIVDVSGMSTIVGKPLVIDPESTLEIIQLQILTRPQEWEGLFDRIEVWRSMASPSGPYEELTADNWLPAVIPNDAGPEPVTPVTGKTLVMAGTSLNIRVDGEDDITISFTDTSPITYAQAASIITSQSAGRFRSYVDGEGRVVLLGTKPGTGAVLEIVGGDAAPLLGFSLVSPGNMATGRDSRVGLLTGKQQYQFTDLRGSKKFFYRTRYRNTNNHAVSEFSPGFCVGQALGVGPGNVVCGYVDLVGIDGRPLANQMVQVYAPVQTSLVEGKLVSGPRQVRTTDANGHAEFTLVRGVKYTVSITGTDLVREIVAPTNDEVKMFSLFEKTVGTQDDMFTVDRPELVYAERRTL